MSLGEEHAHAQVCDDSERRRATATRDHRCVVAVTVAVIVCSANRAVVSIKVVSRFLRRADETHGTACGRYTIYFYIYIFFKKFIRRVRCRFFVFPNVRARFRFEPTPNGYGGNMVIEKSSDVERSVKQNVVGFRLSKFFCPFVENMVAGMTGKTCTGFSLLDFTINFNT